MSPSILAIDQGTTSSRAVLFDANFQSIGSCQQEFPQHYPNSGWVEHNPEDLWNSVLATCRSAIDESGTEASEIAAIGITNQRETVLVWDRKTGKCIYNAIVWQDRRTADRCATLKEAGRESLVTAKTGLLLDPYFSATKIAWILENVEGARDLADKGDLAFGTVDTFLLWRLSGGKFHATDATNASRTSLFNIHSGEWDDELLELFAIPKSMLPRVLDSAADFGETEPGLFGNAIPIRGIAGDQQAATIGQACFQPGMMKATYGTGCFALLNTGLKPVTSNNRMLTTIAYRLEGRTTYALEGSIFIAGAAVQWLRDSMGIIETASATAELAEAADPQQDVYLVPAFTGMGAPYWDAHARGAMFGLTRATGPREFARATLEAVCYQTRDLLEAMTSDWQDAEQTETILRVDGGMSANDWTMQFLSDILDTPVDRPEILETTALGAAYLAGLQVGVYPAMEEFSSNWLLQKRFSPTMVETAREQKYDGWKNAVRRTLSGA
jgi:glycerol kinase